MLAYICGGCLGMEGASDGVGSAEMDDDWAREHHSLRMEEALARAGA